MLVELARDSGVALHRQIEASIRDGIRAGRLLRGTALPPTRRLAAELGVSRGVVIEAYQQLDRRGLPDEPGRRLHARRDRAGAVGRRAARSRRRRAPEIDFCPCRADGSMFPRAAWLRSMRRVLASRRTSATSAAAAPRRCTTRWPRT